MTIKKISLCILLTYGTAILATPATSSDHTGLPSPDQCSPLVIAHRGASGYIPEHTLGSYSVAVTMGADYIEPDLVITKDGHLVARHDNELGLTTDVADHAEFANRKTNKTIDGTEITGWFTEDFTLDEIKTLRAVERIPTIRPGNARMDKSYKIPTFQEIINLAKSFQQSQRRIIGIYPEIKHSTYFNSIGYSIEKTTVNILERNGYLTEEDPIYIQSFEISNLKQLKNMTQLRLLQLMDSDSKQPYDQVVKGTGLTYKDMSTAKGLLDVAQYAYAVGPDKSYIIPRDENNNLGEVTSFVNDAHLAGLKVHPYTFRVENNFLPSEFQNGVDPATAGNLKSELEAYLDAGIDGLFTDNPNVILGFKHNCVKPEAVRLD